MERRLAAILAADVVGYSRLMEEDEAGTLAALKAHREKLIDPKIAVHHGRIVKLMGDGALVEFASVVDAVACAVEIQHDMAERNASVPEERRIEFRIGVHLGDVMVEDEDIYGDGVNVAARLESLAEPGGLCLSQQAYDQVETKLDLGYEDLGEQQVKNIARPVHAYRVRPDGESSVAARPARRGITRGQWLGAATVALLIVVAGVAAWWRPWAPDAVPASVERMAFPLPKEPSIAVLPFNNMSGDPEQEYFADGMTDDLITDLSKISGLFVISRNSAFAYKGKAVDVERVARELGVRYLLEGSVRRAGDAVRINAQLIDGITGGHLWADRYDGSLADVFALQDRVTSKIVAALSVSLTRDERVEQAKPETENPDAHEAFLKGWEHFQKRTPEHYRKALGYFERAVELDPDYGRAHAAMAWIYWNSSERRGDWSPALGLGREEVKELATKSLSKAMTNPTPIAHQVASQMHIWRGKFDEAISEAEEAVTLDRNDADSYSALAEALIRGGRPEESIEYLERARRLDPHNQAWSTFLYGLAQFGMDRFEAAAKSFERAIELDPDTFQPDPLFGWCHPCEPLAAAYGHLGDKDGSQRMVETLKHYAEAYTVSTAVYYWPYKEPADSERFAEGLRKAGIPE